MKKITVVNLITIFLVLLVPLQAAAEPQCSSETAVLMDLKTGQVLFEKDSGKKMFPASTTKILTTLVALKKGNLNDNVVVSYNAASTDGSAVGLQEDEILKLEDLLYAVMLSSANDAAIAVAEHIGGSVEGFARLMNEEARSIGAKNSNFVTPHGLHAPNHYTTASDMALIAKEAMKNSFFKRLASTYSYNFQRNLPKPVNGIPQEDYVNFNKLIWPNSIYRYQGATGIKTGYTDDAGSCLVASAQRDGREYLAVVLKTDRDGIFKDTASLLDYAFNEFKQIELIQKDVELGAVKVKRGAVGTIEAVAADDYKYNIPLTQGDFSVKKKIIWNEKIAAPIHKGQKIGEIVFLTGDKEIGRSDLLADRNVERAPLFGWWHGVLITGLVLLINRSRVRAKARRRRHYYNRRRRYYQENW